MMAMLPLTSTFAANGPTVNILTWWGYLDYPEIRQIIENKCQANISYDNYYSNTEFTRRWNTQEENYDIIIFSDTIYNSVKSEIARKDSDLWKLSNDYNPIIKKHYHDEKMPSNVVYFIHSLTVFLWNPALVQLNESDTIFSIFKKADNNIVVIIDDPIEAANLIGHGLDENKSNSYTLTKNPHYTYLTKENFMKIADRTKVYITNDYSQIYLKPTFAFSFTWSGEAMVDLSKSGKNYNFLIHPKLSYISSDLLAVLNNKPASLCVAKTLASKEVMSVLQNKDFYFSPYADTRGIENETFKSMYQEFIKKLPTLAWVKPVSDEDFRKLSTTWKLIKLNYNH